MFNVVISSERIAKAQKQEKSRQFKPIKCIEEGFMADCFVTQVKVHSNLAFIGDGDTAF